MAAINLPIVSKFDDKGIKQAEKQLGLLGGNLKKLGGILAGAFSVAAITSFAKESIAAAEAVEVANNRLAAISKSMGIFGDETDKVTQRLIKYAEANELNLATDAEVIKATQAKLLTFKELANTADFTGGAFDRATKAAIDLAAAGFGSAETNAVQLGKALQDPIKGISALRRAGITFTEAEKEKIAAMVESGEILKAQNLVLSAIETQVGGTAAATATASEKMKLAFDNLKESVGAALLPSFQNLSQILLPLIEKLGPGLAQIFSALAPVIDKVAVILPPLVEAFVPVIDVFAQVAVLIADLVLALLPLFISILDAVMPAIDALLPLFTEFLKDLIEPLVPAIQTLITAFAPLLEAILPVFVELLNALMPLIVALINDGVTALIPAITGLITAFVPLLTATLPILVDLLKNIVIPAIRVVGSIITSVFSGAVDFITTSLGTIMDRLVPFAKAFGEIFAGIRNFVKPIINSIIGFVQSMANGIIDGINAAIRAINKINVTIPPWVPGIGGESFGFNIPELSRVAIPKLAEGGIVMPQPGGVLANLAEAGKPEAVIPLDRFGGMGTTNTYSITVNAGFGADGSDIGQKIVDEILRYERSSGRVFARA